MRRTQSAILAATVVIAFAGTAIAQTPPSGTTPTQPRTGGAPSLPQRPGTAKPRSTHGTAGKDTAAMHTDVSADAEAKLTTSTR